jgi:hypothetical protein
MDLMRRFDVVDQLARITCPKLVCVGELDAITPVAASLEIVDALPDSLGRFEVIECAGHFPWLDAPDRYSSVIEAFVTSATPSTTQPHARGRRPPHRKSPYAPTGSPREVSFPSPAWKPVEASGELGPSAEDLGHQSVTMFVR